MDGIAKKGVGVLLFVTFLAIALLTFGNLGSGVGSFWYGLNNPNQTQYNTTAGATFSTGSIGGGPSVMETVVLPLIAVVASIIILLSFVKKSNIGK